MRRSRCFQHAPFKAYNRTNILIRLQNNNNFIKIPNFFKKFVTFPQKSLKNPQKHPLTSPKAYHPNQLSAQDRKKLPRLHVYLRSINKSLACEGSS